MPNWDIDSNTIIMLAMEGVNESTNFKDEGYNSIGTATPRRIWTANGGAIISTSKDLLINPQTGPARFGVGSALFNGFGAYISTPDHADFTLGTNDFSIEFWIVLNEIGIQHRVFGQNDSALTHASLSVRGSVSTNNLFILTTAEGSTSYIVSTTTDLGDGNWHFISCIRNGNDLNVYIDGVAEGGTTDLSSGPVSINNPSTDFIIGRSGDFTATTLKGRIDDFRFDNGVARRTADFTVPTSAFAIPILFPWWTIGQANALDVKDIAHSITHEYGSGYHASRAEGTKIQKEIKITWEALTESRWLELVRFWRKRKGKSDGFYMEYPILVTGWENLIDPEDGFDLEIDSATVPTFGSKPVFLVNFTEDELKQNYRKDSAFPFNYKIKTSVTVREVS